MQDALIYAGAALVAYGGTALGFRAAIGKFLGNVTKVKAPGGFEAERPAVPQGPAETAATVTLPSAVAEGHAESSSQGIALSDPPDSFIYTPIEQEFRSHLDRALPGDTTRQLRFVLRALATASTERNHEANYRIMFGSQLRALQFLNQRGGRDQLVNGRELYVVGFPTEDERLAVPFANWWGWLLNCGYIAVGPLNDGNGSVALTPLGRDFLMWMTARGVMEDRYH